MAIISSLMKTDMVTVKPDDLVSEAAKLMSKNHVGAVLVIEGGDLAGILSERDVVERVDTADLPTYQKLEETVYTRQYFVDRIGVFADIRPHLKEECRLQLFPGGLVHVKVLVKSVQRRFYCFLNATQLLAISRILG